MKNIIEIEKKGSYFKVDKEGYLVNPTGLDKIQSEWKPLIDEIIDMYKIMYGENLVSIYIRGSVVKGEAVSGVSDIDTLTYVGIPKEELEYDWIENTEKELLKKYPFCTGIEMGADPVSESEDDQFLIGQSVLVFGKDLQAIQTRLDEKILIHSKKFESTTKWFENKLEEGLPKEEVIKGCAWMCKHYLRLGMELCLLRSKKYSRDLYLCWEQFSIYYPDKSDDMYELLNLALNQTDDIELLKALNKKWSNWFRLELNRDN